MEGSGAGGGTDSGELLAATFYEPRYAPANYCNFDDIAVRRGAAIALLLKGFEPPTRLSMDKAVDIETIPLLKRPAP